MHEEPLIHVILSNLSFDLPFRSLTLFLDSSIEKVYSYSMMKKIRI